MLNGYLNPRLGFPDTGYSSPRCAIYWHKTPNHWFYALYVVLLHIEATAQYICVVDDFGDLVRVP